MGTTADKLNKVLETKEAIRTAINNKGGTLTTSDKFSDYATAIDNIKSGGGDNLLQYIIDNKGGDGKPSCRCLFYLYYGTNLDNIIPQLDTSKVSDMQEMFSGCYNLTTIPPLNTSSATSMNKMFYGCSKLTTIPQLNTSNVTDMDSMFYNCSKLTTDIQLDTSKVTFISELFSGCISLKTISQLDTSKAQTFYRTFFNNRNLTTIPPLNTSSATSMNSAFYNCEKLTIIDITHMNSDSQNDTTSFASYCKSLTKLIIRNMDTIPVLSSDAFTNCYHFYGTTNSTYNPSGLKDGRIYVPDDKVESLKTATNWNVFADIIKPLSFENGEHIGNLFINNSNLSLTTPRHAGIYLDGFTNTPNANITVSNENIAQINNINITTEKITFDINALGTEGNATITVNISGDYNKTLTTEVSYTTPMLYTVEKVDRVTYGFELNSNEYYESTNKLKRDTYSLCKLVFNITEKTKALKLECINDGESSYDFGILSNIDTTLELSSVTDSTNVYKSFKGQSSTKPVVITYPEATVGEHFIYIKYKKDGGGDNGNDSLQFKVIS